jgi:uncharacterized protein HemY
MIYAAELALAAGDKKRAADLLHQLTQLPNDVEWEFEITRDREVARSLLDRLGTR